MVPERDEDLELALSLHRELNGLTRRSRQPSKNYDAALENLKKKRGTDDRTTTTSSGSGSKRKSGGAGRDVESKRMKQLKPLRDSSSEGKRPLDSPRPTVPMNPCSISLRVVLGDWPGHCVYSVISWYAVFCFSTLACFLIFA